MRLLVLGDSCSAGIGAPQPVFGRALHALLAGPHLIENHAVPAATSTDAARWYVRVASRRPWDVVVVYLGNNEGARSPYKGAYRPRRDLRERWRTRRQGPRPLFRIRTPDRDVLDGSGAPVPTATTPADFRANLEAIAARARTQGTRVVLLNPTANAAFPAGLMGPNAAFGKIVGLDAPQADRLDADGPEAAALVDAIARHEAGETDAAARAYGALAAGPAGPVADLATNNLAVLLHAAGEPDEPVALLGDLAAAGRAASPLADHNLARIHGERGEHERADHHAARALAADTALYRVKPAHRAQVAAMAGRPGVDVVDLAEVLRPGDFVDYCHPTAAGHRRIAAAVVARLPSPRPGAVGPGERTYRNVHPGADTAADLGATMADHFALDFDVVPGEVRRAATALLDRARARRAATGERTPCWPEPRSDLEANLLRTFAFACDHPVVPAARDLEHWPPEHGFEVGRFPELYVDRLLCDYAELGRARGVGALPAEVAEHWALAPEDHRMRAPCPLPPADPARLRTDAGYGRRVLAAVAARLADPEPLFVDRRAARVASVKYWYLREAFRFGTPSRAGMLYPHWRLAQLVEGLAVALTVANLAGDAAGDAAARDLLHGLVALRAVHEEHAAAYVAAGYRVLDDAYAEDLAAARRALGPAIARAADPDGPALTDRTPARGRQPGVASPGSPARGHGGFREPGEPGAPTAWPRFRTTPRPRSGGT